MATLNKTMYLNPVPYINKKDDEKMQLISVEYFEYPLSTSVGKLRTFAAYIVTNSDTLSADDCVELVKDRILEIKDKESVTNLFAIYRSTNPDADYTLADRGLANCPEDSEDVIKFLDDFTLIYGGKDLSVCVEYTGDIPGVNNRFEFIIPDATGVTDRKIIKAAIRLTPADKDAIISISRTVKPGEEYRYDPNQYRDIYNVREGWLR